MVDYAFISGYVSEDRNKYFNNSIFTRIWGSRKCLKDVFIHIHNTVKWFFVVDS